MTPDKVIVQLISAATSKNGLKARCGPDPDTCPKGIKVTDAEIQAVNRTSDDFHGGWNHTVSPNAPAPAQGMLDGA